MSYSKRHFRRLVKKKQDEYSIANIRENENGAEFERQDEFVENFNEENSAFVNENFDNYVEEKSFKEKIRDWQFKARISIKNLRALLRILNDSGLDVPLSPSVLMEYKSEKISTQHVSPGDLLYFGFENQIQKIPRVTCLHQITVDINIDGLPLFHSSNKQLWPILLRVVNTENSVVFPVAIYEGRKKPNELCEYLSSFVEEMQHVLKNGVTIDGKCIPVNIRAVICDAPAKSYVCGIAHHTSSHGCSKCTQVAKKIKKKLAYSTHIGNLITNTDFAEKKYEEHHQNKFLNIKSPLENLNLKMISQVPLDPMHLIDLGVTKKMLTV